MTRLVTSLLDMTRIDAGVLEVREAPDLRSPTSCGTPLTALRSTLGDRPVDGGRSRTGCPRSTSTRFSSARSSLTSSTMPTATPHRKRDHRGRRGPRRSGRLSVADTGPGVPPDEQEAVFDRFVRFDTGGRPGSDSTIAKTFVEAHGERIWVEDVPGGGARFVFTLPDRRRPTEPLHRVTVSGG